MHAAFDLGDRSGDGIDLPELAFPGLADVKPFSIGAEVHGVGPPWIKVACTNLEAGGIDGQNASLAEGEEGPAVGR